MNIKGRKEQLLSSSKSTSKEKDREEAKTELGLARLDYFYRNIRNFLDKPEQKEMTDLLSLKNDHEKLIAATRHRRLCKGNEIKRVRKTCVAKLLSAGISTLFAYITKEYDW